MNGREARDVATLAVKVCTEMPREKQKKIVGERRAQGTCGPHEAAWWRK